MNKIVLLIMKISRCRSPSKLPMETGGRSKTMIIEYKKNKLEKTKHIYLEKLHFKKVMERNNEAKILERFRSILIKVR